MRNIKKLLVGYLFLRLIISSFFHGRFSAQYDDFDINFFEWLIRNISPLVIMVFLLFAIPAIYGYVIKYSEKFGADAIVVGSVLFTPVLILFISMLGVGRDAIPQMPTTDAHHPTAMFMDIRILLGLIRDIEDFLRARTIVGMSAFHFVRDVLWFPLLALTVWNIIGLFITLKKVIFKYRKPITVERLHFIVSSFIMAFMSMWMIYIVVFMRFPLQFEYNIPRDPLSFLLDTLYFSSTTWILGSPDFIVATPISQALIIFTVFCNLLFFIFFIAGITFENPREKVEPDTSKRRRYRRRNGKNMPANMPKVIKESDDDE